MDGRGPGPGVYSEHFDGTAWTFVPGDNPGAQGTTFAGAVGTGPNDGWAVGQVFDPDRALLERFNGTRWVDTPPPTLGAVPNDIAEVSPADLWAVGAFRNGTWTAHYDGSAWTRIPSPRIGDGPNALRDVAAFSSHDVWAVGDAVAGGTSITLTEHWDGSSWQVVPSPNGSGDDHLYGVGVDPATGQVWAVGLAGHHPLILRFRSC